MKERKPKLSKLGTLLDKMLDQEDSWVTYEYDTTKYLNHPRSCVYLQLLNDGFVDTADACLTENDKLLLTDKTRNLYAKKKMTDVARESRARAKMKAAKRTLEYRRIMKNVLGVEQ